MNLKLFLCGNCQNKEEEDIFLNFDNKDSNNNNDRNNKKKILLTSLDTDNSVNNILEIIEYPYSNTYNNNNDKNNNYIPMPLQAPLKTDTINKKYTNNCDDYLDIIKPPKLFNEGKKEKNEKLKNKENKIWKKKVEKEPKEREEFSHDKINNNIKIKSVNFSDYVYNENRFSHNKNIILLNKDNSNCNYNYTYNNQSDEKKNNSKDSKDRIVTINHFKKISGNINGLKVDYPCPDTDSFFLKSCNDEFNLNEQNKDNNHNKIKKISNNHAKEVNNKMLLKKMGKKELKNKKKFCKKSDKEINDKNILNKKENEEKNNYKNNNTHLAFYMEDFYG